MAELQPISSEDIAAAEASSSGGAYISDRFRVDNVNKDDGPKANYTVAGICSIIAFIAFAVAVAILVQDWKFLSVA